MNRLARLLAFLLLTAPVGAAAQTPGSNPGQFAAVSRRVVFVTSGTETGARSDLLWSTDGTAAGTEMLTVLCSGLYCREPRLLGRLPGIAFYAAGASESDPNLFRVWRTDGTREGTYPISPLFIDSSESSVVILGGRLVFNACEESGTCSLWSTGGGEAERLREGMYANGFVVVGGTAYFPGGGSASPGGLWRTDGTAAGTELIREVFPAYLTVSGSRLFFLAGGDDYPEDLWVSDGTKAGTHRVKKFFEPNHYQSQITSFLKAVPGGVVFVGVPAGENVLIPNLWWSDGTRRGTRPITAFQGNAGVTRLRPDQIAAAGGRIFFVAEGLAGPRLWSTRGSLATSAPVTGCPGGCPAVLPASPLAPAGGQVVFAGLDAAHGAEPWASDGTGPGTRLLSDLCAGPCGSSPQAFTPHGGLVDFRATWNGRTRLVRTDGTATLPLARVPASDSPQIDLADLGVRTFFAGFDAAHGSQPWVTDGTRAGTRRIAALESSF